jgi:uncharacterized protein YqiB (DUF1249 family)
MARRLSQADGTSLHGSQYKVDLSALLATCESNYWRLKKLLPDLESQDECRVHVPDINSKSQQEKTILFRVTERCPYTMTLDLVDESCVDAPQDSRFDPGLFTHLSIRIYNDVKSAEVIAFQKRRHFVARYDYPNRQMHQPDEKMQLNLLLSEWLTHCLHYGHKKDQEILQAVFSH